MSVVGDDRHWVRGGLAASRDEMARMLRVSKRWLDAKVREGRIPSIKVGGRRLFDPQAVRQALFNAAVNE